MTSTGIEKQHARVSCFSKKNTGTIKDNISTYGCGETLRILNLLISTFQSTSHLGIRLP